MHISWLYIAFLWLVQIYTLIRYVCLAGIEMLTYVMTGPVLVVVALYRAVAADAQNNKCVYLEGKWKGIEMVK